MAEPESEQHSGPPTESRDLDRSLVHGLAWTGGVKMASQILSWLSTLVVARLLLPSDYGISSMAMVYVGLVQLINEFGLGAAIVQRRDLTESEIAKLGGLSALLGAFFTLLSLAMAKPVAWFFGDEAIVNVILVLSITFVTSGFQVLPRALLTRDLRFRQLAVLDTAEAVSTTVVALILAIEGAGYWALVLGSLTGRLVSTVLAVLWHRHRLAWPTPLASIAGPVTYGSHVLGAGLAWYAFRNADLTIIGKVLGKNPLGAYTLGWNLASVPVDRISQLLGRTAPPVLAKVQNDPPALRRYVLLLTEGVAALTFPLAIGLALVAPNFVVTVLGEKWQFATRALQILALSACFRAIQPLLNLVLLATGQSRRAMEANIIQAIVLSVLFLVGARVGIEGVALVWLIGYPIVAALFYVRHAFAVCELGYGQYLRSLWPALSGCVVMSLAVLAFQRLLPTTWPLGLDLWLQCGVGALAYTAALLAFHRSRVRTFLSAVKLF